MIKALPFVVLAAVSPSEAVEAPQAWRCSNAGLAEVRCGADGCRAAEESAYTPMQASVGAGTLEVCAYSGCVSGTAALAGRLEGHAVWTARIEGEAPASLMVETGSGVGLLRWGGFANPMLCRPQGADGADARR